MPPAVHAGTAPNGSSRAQAIVAVGLAAVLSACLLVGAVAAAGAASGPPPTPVPPSGSLSPFPTVLHTPPPSTTAPRLTARAAILESALTGQVLFAKQPNQRRPIASVTKLMTALVAVEHRRPDHVVTVASEATSESGSVLGLAAGERISVLQLLYALLLQSSNDAAVALADDVAGSTPAFVELMNRKAERLGMSDSDFRSTNGLDDRGYSSAADLAVLLRGVIEVPSLRAIMATRVHTIANPAGPARVIQNRNALLWLYPGAFAGKTGFTSAAGFCLVAAAERDGRQLVAVVLGDGSDASFDDTATLLNYGFGAFAKRKVVTEGQVAGSIQVDGQAVEAAAGRTLVRLVREDRTGEIHVQVDPGDALSLPVVAGQTIGRVVVLAHGVQLGAVRAVAAATVRAPPRRPPGAVPGSSARGSIDLLAELLRATFGLP